MSAPSIDPVLDSPAAWARLALALTIASIGGVGLWSAVVLIPDIQSQFGVSRADASMVYALQTIGFAGGGILMGRLSDRHGIFWPLALGLLALSIGYVLAGLAPTLWTFGLAYGLLIGFGCSVTLGPLIADTSYWFVRRRGTAVSICACGNYISGVIWPPVVQYFNSVGGFRATHIGIGIFCACVLVPMTLAMRRRPPPQPLGALKTMAAANRELGVSPKTLQIMLSVAGLACCTAMAMPQVHIVAYCGDLGYGVARGAEMLSLMLGFGVVSRILSGIVADRIGGVPTLLLGSILQGVALFLYLLFDGLTSLYVISALFGLFQGGIVPSYAIIVREYFPPQEAGARFGFIIMFTLLGMALGGWMSGLIFDITGTYRLAFANGLAWNLLNMSIALWLLLRPGRRLAPA